MIDWRIQDLVASPSGSNFMQFSGKNRQNNSLVDTPPPEATTVFCILQISNSTILFRLQDNIFVFHASIFDCIVTVKTCIFL